jgi:hypothetical protein
MGWALQMLDKSSSYSSETSFDSGMSDNTGLLLFVVVVVIVVIFVLLLL